MMQVLKAALGPIVKPLIDKIPDVNKRRELEHEFETQVLTAVSGVVQAQIAVNQEEAKHPSVFVSGWRPSVGWVCTLGLGYNFIIYPFLLWFSFAFGANVEDAPKLEIGPLAAILTGMLGLSINRTYDKIHGVARSNLAKNKPKQ